MVLFSLPCFSSKKPKRIEKLSGLEKSNERKVKLQLLLLFLLVNNLLISVCLVRSFDLKVCFLHYLIRENCLLITCLLTESAFTVIEFHLLAF